MCETAPVTLGDPLGAVERLSAHHDEDHGILSGSHLQQCLVEPRLLPDLTRCSGKCMLRPSGKSWSKTSLLLPTAAEGIPHSQLPAFMLTGWWVADSPRVSMNSPWLSCR